MIQLHHKPRIEHSHHSNDFSKKIFGGGGHKNAAGMRYEGTFEEFKKEFRKSEDRILRAFEVESSVDYGLEYTFW